MNYVVYTVNLLLATCRQETARHGDLIMMVVLTGNTFANRRDNYDTEAPKAWRARFIIMSWIKRFRPGTFRSQSHLDFGVVVVVVDFYGGGGWVVVIY